MVNTSAGLRHPEIRPAQLRGSSRATSVASGDASGPRVMHVLFTLQPGGMEYGVIKLVNALQDCRIQSSICSTRPGTLKGLVHEAVPVIELDRRAGNDPRLVWQLYRLFRRMRPDIVHTHGWGTLLEGLAAARLAGVPRVVHGEHGTLQLRTHQRWLQRAGWSLADRVLSVSSRLAERMAREVRFPLERIDTIRNGVDLDRFGRIGRVEARLALGLRPDSVVAGTVGRLVAVKDHATLLESLATLRRTGLQPTLVIAGEGPLRAAIEEQIAALDLSGQVRLLGHRPDVETVLAALDVFVLSSSSEGLSNTILEAMATGLPVVSTRVGGADELVEHQVTGELVPSRSPEALSTALAALVNDPHQRATMGAAGRRRVETMFELTATMRRYETLYRDLVETTGPAS